MDKIIPDTQPFLSLTSPSHTFIHVTQYYVGCILVYLWY